MCDDDDEIPFYSALLCLVVFIRVSAATNQWIFADYSWASPAWVGTVRPFGPESIVTSSPTPQRLNFNFLFLDLLLTQRQQ